MSQMRHNILQNLHLSRTPFETTFENMMFNKESFKISVSGSSQKDAWIMPGLLMLTNNSLLTAKKFEAKFGDSTSWMDTHFFGSSFLNMYELYFTKLSAFVSDWNSVTALPNPSNFYLILDWCTNFYNAYDNLYWFPYVEKPSFFICLLTKSTKSNPAIRYSRICYLTAYFSKNPI